MNTKRKITAFIVLTLILAVGITSVFGATKSEINQSITTKQNQLSEGQKEVVLLNLEISDLEKKVSQAQSEVNAMAGEIAATQEKVDQLTKTLDAKQKELEVSIDGLNQRLRNMYKSGVVGFIDVVLSSSNGTELLYNLDMVQRIYSGDRELVDSLKAEYEKIKVEQAELKKVKDDLEAKKATLTTKQNALQNDQTALANKKGTVSNSNAQLESEIADLKAQSAAVTEQIQSSPVSNQGSYSGGAMLWPCPSSYVITSPFSYRNHPIFGEVRFHTGIDIGGSYGSDVIAAKEGTVLSSGWNGGYGNTVIIVHGGGISTLYAHNSSLLVSPGQYVSAGQVIAKVGSTGNSTGPHLHFEVREGGQPVDPMNYL